MADVLKRLAGPVSLNSSATTVYTVPASTKGVVRNLHACNETAITATFSLSIGTDGAGKRLFKELAIPANGAYDWSGSLVLNAADVVQAYCGSVGAITLVLSGVESS